MATIRPVILSGGSGTRLWPLSTPQRPKQFADLFPGRPPLFDSTLTRLTGLADVTPPLIVTGADHLGLVEESLARTGMNPGTIIVEPVGRNTAPAAMAAALASDPADCLVLLPSDHLVADTAAFRSHVGEAVEAAQGGEIVTFGIKPTKAETGYGYIQAGESRGAARMMIRFKEKPGEEEAARLAGDGSHFWNSGIFVLSAATLIRSAERHCPQVLEQVRAAFPASGGAVLGLGSGFSDAESISFDHAVMERAEGSLVIPISVGWDDVGSYHALWEVSDKDVEGNAVFGNVVLTAVSNSYIRSTTGPLAVADLTGVVVVVTEEGTLVAPLESSQVVRDLAGRVVMG